MWWYCDGLWLAVTAVVLAVTHRPPDHSASLPLALRSSLFTLLSLLSRVPLSLCPFACRYVANHPDKFPGASPPDRLADYAFAHFRCATDGQTGRRTDRRADYIDMARCRCAKCPNALSPPSAPLSRAPCCIITAAASPPVPPSTSILLLLLFPSALSFCSGIFASATIYMLAYGVVAGNAPKLYPRITVPAMISGGEWRAMHPSCTLASLCQR